MKITSPIRIKGDAYCYKTKDEFSFEVTVSDGEITRSNIAELIYRIELDIAFEKRMPRLKITSFEITK